jgi:hypothetical protein
LQEKGDNLKKIFVVSYAPGMFGEFLANEVSLDNNFYKSTARKEKNNRIRYNDVLTKDIGICIDTTLHLTQLKKQLN